MKIDIEEVKNTIDSVAEACFLRAAKQREAGDERRAVACELAGNMVRLAKVLICEGHGIDPGKTDDPRPDLRSIFGPSLLAEDLEDAE